MLHILWILIKIILIILGTLLGLVLLALLLVLFCPVRYRGDVVKSTDNLKETTLCATISWLLHVVHVRICFENGKLTKKIRILGLPILEMMERMKTRKKCISPKKTKESFSKKNVKNDKQPDTFLTEQLTVEDRSVKKTSEEMILEDEILKEEDVHETKVDYSKKFENIIVSIQEKLKRVLELYDKIRSKFKSIYETIGWWKNFLLHPKVKAAISLVKDDLVKLLKHIFPTKVKGNVTFGSEDPSTTGTVLAVLGITMPFHKNKIQVNPVFDGSNILIGDVSLKGRIYGVVLVKIVLEIIFNKNVKYIIHRWKHKED